LIRAILEDLGAHFVPNGVLIYLGDTDGKRGYFDAVSLARLGVSVGAHGKLPDVVMYYPERNRLFLIESVTSHGPINRERRAELARLIANATADLVLSHRLSQPGDHEPPCRRDRLGNGSVGGGRHLTSDSFQRWAAPWTVYTGHY
jgi:hypothetical protein